MGRPFLGQTENEKDEKRTPAGKLVLEMAERACQLSRGIEQNGRRAGSENHKKPSETVFAPSR